MTDLLCDLTLQPLTERSCVQIIICYVSGIVCSQFNLWFDLFDHIFKLYRQQASILHDHDTVQIFSLLRAHEQELTKRHERELAELNAVHSRETQNMLSDFNKAQEVLKDKISALQILYVLTANTPCALQQRRSMAQAKNTFLILRARVGNFRVKSKSERFKRRSQTSQPLPSCPSPSHVTPPSCSTSLIIKFMHVLVLFSSCWWYIQLLAAEEL